jgi:hypothetical protein
MHLLMTLTPVTTPIALIAFIVAAAFYAYRTSLLQKRKALAGLPASDKIIAVEATLASFRIDTTGLSNAKKFDLAMAQIRARAQRFLIGSIVVCFLAVLTTVVSIVTLLSPVRPPTPSNESARPSTVSAARAGLDTCLDQAKQRRLTTDQMISAVRACEAQNASQ